MKTVFISFLVVLFSSVSAFAAGTSGDYSGNLNVVVDGTPALSKTQVVNVTDAGTTVIIIIKNFTFADWLPSMDITVTASIATDGTLTFVSIDVLGMDVSVNSFSGSLSGGNCYINMELYALFQTINVTFNGTKIN